uniref:Uncharacterized protein n=1 Tax=Clytia hemisphaerica TaxID=252671 RepID=A0A7M5UVI1_9CNID
MEIGNDKDSNLNVTDPWSLATKKSPSNEKQQPLNRIVKNCISFPSSINAIQNQETSAIQTMDYKQCTNSTSTRLQTSKLTTYSHQNYNRNSKGRTLLDSRTGHTILTNSTTHSPIVSVKIHSSNSLYHPRCSQQNQRESTSTYTEKIQTFKKLINKRKPYWKQPKTLLPYHNNHHILESQLSIKDHLLHQSYQKRKTLLPTPRKTLLEPARELQPLMPELQNSNFTDTHLMMIRAIKLGIKHKIDS